MMSDKFSLECVSIALAFGCVLLVVVGCGVSDDPTESNAAYTLETEYSGLGSEMKVEFADIDDDGTDDLLTWNSRQVVATQLTQPRENLLDDTVGQDEFLYVDIVDVYGEDRRLPGIGLARDGLSTSKIVYRDREGNDHEVELDSIGLQCWPLPGGGPDTRSALRPRVLLENNDPPVLLATIHTDYFPARDREGIPDPRGLAAYRWPDGDTLWTRRFGPNPASYGIRESESGNGYEIILGTYAPGNGAEHNGLSDSSCWVLSYDMQGTELWRARFGGHQCGASVLTGKAGSDQASRIFVGLGGSARIQAERALIELDPETGTPSQHLYLDSSVEDLRWLGDDLDGGEPTILTLLRSNDALLVNTDLNVLKRVSIPSGEASLKLSGELIVPAGGGKRRASVFKSSSFVRVYTSDLGRLLALSPFQKTLPHECWTVRHDGKSILIAIQDGESLTIYGLQLRPLLSRWVDWISDHPLLVTIVVLVCAAILILLFRYKDQLSDVRLWIRGLVRIRRQAESALPPKPDDLFNDALELPPERRNTFLTRACMGDVELKAEVESLLASSSKIPCLVRQEAPLTPTDLETIGRYPILGEVGRGGMGVVYLARDHALDRQIAIKVLPDRDVSDQRFGRMLAREARMAAKISHANVATVYSFEEVEGLRFITMEYVPGETLAGRLEEGPMSMTAAMHTCHEIATAMEAAHEGGVVHRDLKPANIKLVGEGKVKVLDFGIAKSIHPDDTDSQSRTSLTPSSDAFLGTPGYMSPEQMLAGTVDHRTDIWALGCIMYECLTGRPAFGEKILEAGVFAHNPKWERLPGQTPMRIRRLLRRCLRKEMEKREFSMTNVRREIERVLQWIG